MAQENRSRRAYLAAVSAVGLAGVAGCSGNGDGNSPADNESPENETLSDDTGTETSSNGDDTTETPSESEDNETTDTTDDPSERQIPGEVSNDLTGLVVVDHEATIGGEDGFSGTVTIRNNGDHTTRLTDYVIKYILYDADGSIVTSVGGFRSDNPEPAAGEESANEFFPGPASRDEDFTVVESYELELTCDVFSEGVYCPEE